MRFGFFRSHQTPILADFGSSGVKLLQIEPGDKPTVSAGAFIPFPDEMRSQAIDKRFELLAAELPGVLKTWGFRGNRAIVSPFSQHMLVQHIGVPATESADALSFIRTQIAIALSCASDSLVVRTTEVCETNRDGQPKIEHIAFAMSRPDVMRYVELFKRSKIDVVGVHGEIAALVHAFDHVNRREADSQSVTVYLDLGYGATKVAVCHGTQLVFAKSVAIGGRTFDTRIAEARRVSLAEARIARIAEGLGAARLAARPAADPAAGLAILRAAVTAAEGAGTSAPPRPASATAGIGQLTGELVEHLADELSMCMRYHDALFPGRRVERVVFLGGESRDTGLCQTLAAALRMPAKSGDPLTRYLANGPAPAGLPEPNAPHPGWAVVCGLSTCPTDL